MKLFREGIIIIGIYILGEIVSKQFNLPVPGNILGMLILLFLLIFKVIKVEQVETITNFFLSHLAFFFIPAGVGLMTSMGIIKENGVQITLICIITTIIIIGVTGHVVQFIANRKMKEEK
ncbi:MAG: CidA/LrgA family protein [Clostridium sp.]